MHGWCVALKKEVKLIKIDWHGEVWSHSTVNWKMTWISIQGRKGETLYEVKCFYWGKF